MSQKSKLNFSFLKVKYSKWELRLENLLANPLINEYIIYISDKNKETKWQLSLIL